MKILLALDGSRFSEIATNLLIGHTKATGAEVRLLHVVESFPESLAKDLGSADAPAFAAARLQRRNWSEELLAQAAEKLISAGFKVTSSIVEGDPKSAILDMAEAWGADLIVVGSHGRTGLERFLIGSVSEAVARHARCSVEIVRSRSGR
jgi:nucleotide-binding universal stress UspA family protein